MSKKQTKRLRRNATPKKIVKYTRISKSSTGSHIQITPKKLIIRYDDDKERLIHEMSGKIQWLIDLAGSGNVVEGIIDHFGHKNVTIEEVKNLPKDGKHTMFFKTAYPNTTDQYKLMVRAGHWIYYDKKGNHWNSYDLMHQRKSTNQFCQTFALIYAVSDYWTRKSNYPNWSASLKQNDFSNNICVVVDFWKYMFNYPGLADWLIREVKIQNEQTIKNNQTEKYEKDKVELISNDSHMINKKLVDSKLNDICANAQDISDYAP